MKLRPASEVLKKERLSVFNNLVWLEADRKAVIEACKVAVREMIHEEGWDNVDREGVIVLLDAVLEQK